MPDIDMESDVQWKAVWALLDSGRSVHVANAARHFPGAEIQQPPSNTKGFQTADGKTISNLGHTVTHLRTQEGFRTGVQWKNAKVAMQILSTHEIAKNNKELRDREREGDIVDLQTGHITKFIAAAGVCVVTTFRPKKLAQGRCKIPDFGGPEIERASIP